MTAYDKECIEHAKRIVESDLHTHWSIAAIAVKVGIGRTKLVLGFKALYGVGLYAYLRQLRMEKAAELLSNSYRPIKDIARSTGFNHTSNFTISFTDYYGQTPTEYRRNGSF